jgi:hypothetical protein
MGKKLAITISGAVSLGSYESGVAFELLDAIAQHNQWADANNQPNQRFEIDVLTGASAGGMTAAILRQRLLFDGLSMSQPYNNPLEKRENWRTPSHFGSRSQHTEAVVRRSYDEVPGVPARRDGRCVVTGLCPVLAGRPAPTHADLATAASSDG